MTVGLNLAMALKYCLIMWASNMCVGNPNLKKDCFNALTWFMIVLKFSPLVDRNSMYANKGPVAWISEAV